MAIPVDRFRQTQDGRLLLTDVDEAELEQMPDYDSEQYVELQ